MKNYQKILCCLLALCICFMCWARPAAQAEALTITGAAVMSIAVVACIVIMLMSSMDVIDALKDMASSKSMLPSQLVQQYIILFLSKTAVSVGSLLNTFKAGVRYKSDGTIYLSETVSVWIQQFLTWLWSPMGGGMADFGSAGSSSIQTAPLVANGVEYLMTGTIYLSSIVFFEFVYNDVLTRYEYSGGVNYGAFVFGNSPIGYVLGASTASFTCRYTITYLNNGQIAHDETITASSFDSPAGKVYYVDLLFGQVSMASGANIPFSRPTFSNTVGADRLTAAMILAYGDLTLDGDINVGVLDLPEGMDTNVLEPQDTLVLPAPIGLDIEEYLTGTVDVLLEGTGEFTGTDDETVTVEGTETAVPVDQTTYGTLTGTETISIDTTLTGTESLSIDLTDFFPFCIPFDIYKLLSLLSSTRQAPYIEWRFYIPNVCDETIVLDFSVFDPLAATLRHLELFAFAVGLAAATKKLIQGGD